MSCQATSISNHPCWLKYTENKCRDCTFQSKDRKCNTSDEVINELYPGNPESICFNPEICRYMNVGQQSCDSKLRSNSLCFQWIVYMSVGLKNDDVNQRVKSYLTKNLGNQGFLVYRENTVDDGCYFAYYMNNTPSRCVRPYFANAVSTDGSNAATKEEIRRVVETVIIRNLKEKFRKEGIDLTVMLGIDKVEWATINLIRDYVRQYAKKV